MPSLSSAASMVAKGFGRSRFALAVLGAAFVMVPAAGAVPICAIATVTSCDLTENARSFTLQLTGGPITTTPAGGTITGAISNVAGPFADPGRFWSIALNLTLTDGPPDVVNLSGSIFHRIGPDPGEDSSPAGGGVAGLAFVIADQLRVDRAPNVVLMPASLRRPHLNHVDFYTQGGAVIPGTNNNIDSWSITIQGFHIPEPPVIGVFALGLLALGAATARMRRER